MRQPISFLKFIKLDITEQQELQKPDYEGMTLWLDPYLSEDSNGVAIKRKKIKELEALLKKHDYFFMYASGRAYDKGKESEEEIEALVSDIGKEGLALYRKYLKKNESANDENTQKMDIQIQMSGKSLDKFFEGMSPSDKASVISDMKILEKLLKKHNWTNKKEEEAIRELVVGIHELGSPLGFELYKKYADKAGVKIRYFEEEKKEPNHKSIEELVKEIANKSSNTPNRNISLGLGEERRAGEKSITASSFCDAGNLFENQPTYIPPSKERSKRIK